MTVYPSLPNSIIANVAFDPETNQIINGPCRQGYKRDVFCFIYEFSKKISVYVISNLWNYNNDSNYKNSFYNIIFEIRLDGKFLLTPEFIDKIYQHFLKVNINRLIKDSNVLLLSDYEDVEKLDLIWLNKEFGGNIKIIDAIYNILPIYMKNYSFNNDQLLSCIESMKFLDCKKLPELLIVMYFTPNFDKNFDYLSNISIANANQGEDIYLLREQSYLTIEYQKIKKGIPIDELESHQYSYFLIYHSMIDPIKALVGYIPTKEDFYNSCRFSSIDIVKYLYPFLSYTNNMLDKAFLITITHNKIETAKFLYDILGSLSREYKDPSSKHKFSNLGQYCFIMACSKGNLEIAKLIFAPIVENVLSKLNIFILGCSYINFCNG